jgi:hypothetical protein
MNKPIISSLATFLALTTATAAFADSMPSREEMWKMLQAQQKRIQELESRQSQSEHKVDKVVTTVESGSKAGGGSSWSDKISISGLVEVEASSTENQAGNMAALANGSDINLATAELSIDAQVNPWVSANVTLLYEDDGATALNVDTATITIGNSDASPFSLTAGQMTLPFGVYDTNILSDPLTLELAETADTTVMVALEMNGISADVYAFNGTSNKEGSNNTVDQFGFNLGYAYETERVGAAIGLHYINSIENSDGISAAIIAAEAGGMAAMQDYSGAWGINGNVVFAGFTLIGEYIKLSDSITNTATTVGWTNTTNKPSAWQTELAYGFQVAEKDVTVAASGSGTNEAQAIGLMEKRLGLATSVGLFENTNLTLEWVRNYDYDVSEGGSGNDADSMTMQLAVEF